MASEFIDAKSVKSALRKYAHKHRIPYPKDLYVKGEKYTLSPYSVTNYHIEKEERNYQKRRK